MKLKCGCGNIEIEWGTKLSLPVARQCGCEYCLKQNCHYVSDSDSTVYYKIVDSSLLNIIKHGTETAKFFECINCGLVLVTSEIDHALYSVLNAKALAISAYSLDPEIKNFSDESVTERLLRRKSNWCKTKICT